jgi:hypothetical protein
MRMLYGNAVISDYYCPKNKMAHFKASITEQ